MSDSRTHFISALCPCPLRCSSGGLVRLATRVSCLGRVALLYAVRTSRVPGCGGVDRAAGTSVNRGCIFLPSLPKYTN